MPRLLPTDAPTRNTGRRVKAAAVIAALALTTTPAHAELDRPPTPTRPAIREHIPDPPPPTPEQIVNNITYHYGHPGPALIAYRITAEARGWTTQSIDDWERFMHLMEGESGYCPNLRRGATLEGDGTGCTITKQGTHTDAGFGQLIAIWYDGPDTLVCSTLLLCTAEQIVSTPWHSMLALLVVIEHHGAKPWCFRHPHTGVMTHRDDCPHAPTALPLTRIKA
jgi:hypothetical protein